MKTSSTQFEMLVSYMEQHGDLTKLSKCPAGRAQNYNSWMSLVNLLNSDSTGDSKSYEKWKKVWSDLKNNTKRKAARLHRAASGTGGGPAMHAKLTDLEQRILALVGMQAATGLNGIEEAGFVEQTPIELVVVEAPTTSSTRQQNELSIIEENEAWIEPSIHTNSPPQQPITGEAARVTSPFTPARRYARENEASVVAPSPSGRTPRTRRSRRAREAPQRRLTKVDQATQFFLKSEEEWRKIKMEQHRDWIEVKREQCRIREMEVEAQREQCRVREMEVNLIRGWQVLLTESIDILKTYVQKKD